MLLYHEGESLSYQQLANVSWQAAAGPIRNSVPYTLHIFVKCENVAMWKLRKWHFNHATLLWRRKFKLSAISKCQLAGCSRSHQEFSTLYVTYICKMRECDQVTSHLFSILSNLSICFREINIQILRLFSKWLSKHFSLILYTCTC